MNANAPPFVPSPAMTGTSTWSNPQQNPSSDSHLAPPFLPSPAMIGTSTWSNLQQNSSSDSHLAPPSVPSPAMTTSAFSNLQQNSSSNSLLAPSFVPSPAMNTSNSFDLQQNSGSDLIVNTLLTEIELHREARRALEAAQLKITTLTDENKSLQASNMLLKANVENNKTEQSHKAAKHVSTSEEVQDAANNWIIADPLEQQREFYEAQGYPLNNTYDKYKAVKQEKKQEDGLYDLSQVTPSKGKHAMYRQFLNDDDVEMKDSPPASASPSKATSEYLIELTPPPKNPASKPLPTVTEAVESYKQAIKPFLVVNESVKNLATHPSLQLPAAFLAKYRKPEKTAVETKLAEVTSNSELPKIADQGLIKPRSETELAQVTSSSDLPETTNRSPVKPSSVIDDMIPNAMRVPVLDTKIKWTMNSRQPVFKDQNQLLLAMKIASHHDHSGTSFGKAGYNHTTYFWQHPVRFLPSQTEKNLYRTVMIDYLPLSSTYEDVLQHVRTGALQSIQLFPPIRGSTNFTTARVVFNYETSAVSMVMQYQKKMNAGDPMKVNGTVVRVWQVLTPTYPANKEIEHDIFVNGYTRILLLDKVEGTGVLPELHTKYIVQEMQEDSVVKIGRAGGGVPMVEFASVKAAAGAFRRLQKDRAFKGCIFDFDRDYCEDSYESE